MMHKIPEGANFQHPATEEALPSLIEIRNKLRQQNLDNLKATFDELREMEGRRYQDYLNKSQRDYDVACLKIEAQFVRGCKHGYA